jgi:CBS domain-containing protein
MMNEPLSSIMSTNLLTIKPDEPLSKARQILIENNVHHVPVVEGKKLIGMVTAYDLFKLTFPPYQLNQISVREVMTTKLATLSPDDKVGTAAEIFLEHLFHAVPIVKDGDLVGLVTSHDVMRYEFMKAYPSQFTPRK